MEMSNNEQKTNHSVEETFLAMNINLMEFVHIDWKQRVKLDFQLDIWQAENNDESMRNAKEYCHGYC